MDLFIYLLIDCLILFNFSDKLRSRLDQKLAVIRQIFSISCLNESQYPDFTVYNILKLYNITSWTYVFIK